MIFEKAVKQIDPLYRPHIVIVTDIVELSRLNRQDRDPIHEIDIYENFWFENGMEGALVNFNPENYELTVAIFNVNGDTIDLFQKKIDAENIKVKDDVTVHQGVLVTQILFTMYLIAQARKNKRQSVFTGQRNKASIYYRQGDTVRWKRIWDANKLPSPIYQKPEPGASGIRKREHDVIGHWRTYKSGARVFVKPHKRGDPSLGRVTKLLTE
jgi:hypothetical protein